MRAIWNYDADLIVLQFLKLDSLPSLRRAYQTSPVPGQLHCQSQTCSNVGALLMTFKMTFDDDLMTTGPAAWLTTPEEPWLVSPESNPSLSFPLSSPGNRQEIFVRVGGQRRLFECLFCPPFLSPSHISCHWYHGTMVVIWSYVVLNVNPNIRETWWTYANAQASITFGSAQ